MQNTAAHLKFHTKLCLMIWRNKEKNPFSPFFYSKCNNFYLNKKTREHKAYRLKNPSISQNSSIFLFCFVFFCFHDYSIQFLQCSANTAKVFLRKLFEIMQNSSQTN